MELAYTFIVIGESFIHARFMRVFYFLTLRTYGTRPEHRDSFHFFYCLLVLPTLFMLFGIRIFIIL